MLIARADGKAAGQVPGKPAAGRRPMLRWTILPMRAFETLLKSPATTTGPLRL